MWLWISGLVRRLRLWASITGGWLQSITRRGWWPFLSTLGLVVAALIVGPLLLDVAASVLKDIGVDEVDPAPKVGDWLSLTNVALLMLGVLFVRWIGHARERVVVESFVDFTKDNAKAVSGLSTLLVTELGRLRELYQQIDDLSVPTAVGVERHGGFGRGKDAASFLTVSADDVTDVLEGAIASDARVEVGPAKIPIGPLLAFVNRLTRGPRVVGSVHLTEAGGGPTITAQLVSRESGGTWRVDQPREPESPEQRRAFLDSMVRELACRMFTQLTLRGAVRWQAVSAFNDYLRLYGDSRRTPRDRARFLKQAQSRLLSAVAEDERFDLAYYNLGVIYTQLAQTERLAEQQSDDATSRANFDRSRLDAARREAARVAFLRAAAKNPDRWEAYYAQAVTRFSEIDPDVRIDERLAPDDPRRDDLRTVVALCEQALAVSPGQGASVGAVYDLRGMAEIRLGDFQAAMRSHRKAVRHSWSEYCRASRHDRARPTRLPELTDRARANATAALHNLALAYERRALLASAGAALDLSAAQRIFRSAARLAGEGSEVAAACHFERGAALERAGRFREAADEFRSAGRINRRSCEYRARQAQALASEHRRLRDHCPDSGLAKTEANARQAAADALELLAQPFSLAVMANTAEALDLECDATLAALKAAYETLGDEDGAARVEAIRDLKRGLAAATTFEDTVTGKRCKRDDPEVGAAELRPLRVAPSLLGLDWELDQVELALGRLHADARSWSDAETIFGALLQRLIDGKRLERLVEFGAYAHLARAQRESARAGGDPQAYVSALRIAAEGVRRDPLNVEARREAGRAHFALGQYSDALAAWNHALWLSPSDPYLHYEVAMCHRRMASRQDDESERRRMTGWAARHFEQAQELFDGEDLDGEAWTRLWRGKIALEAGKPVEALSHFEGAEHGSATAAAAVLIGEAYLELEQRPAAAQAFERCELALQDARQTGALSGHDTIDSLWGDEMPVAAVRARIKRGMAEAKHLSPGDWQNGDKVAAARRLLNAASRALENLKDAGARDEAMAKILDTEVRLLCATGEIDHALDKVRERMRYETTPDARRLEAELLDLRAEEGKRINDRTRTRIAATHAWEAVRSDGHRRRPQRA
jgi:tetratricopeptide (TPR) repeat protein